MKSVNKKALYKKIDDFATYIAETYGPQLNQQNYLCGIVFIISDTLSFLRQLMKDICKLHPRHRRAVLVYLILKLGPFEKLTGIRKILRFPIALLLSWILRKLEHVEIDAKSLLNVIYDAVLLISKILRSYCV